MAAQAVRAPASWIPARWEGGPLELARRTQMPSDPAVRGAIEKWYDPSTLRLLDGSRINCLLASWSGVADAALERRQQRLVTAYAAEAHKRGIAVLGLIYPGPNAANAAAEAGALDGLVLDGDFPAPLRGGPALKIRIWPHAPSARASNAPVIAVRGVSPGSRNLADMGIRAAPSSEPWIESNIWLVRSLRGAPPFPTIWIDQQPGGSPKDYDRAVADAAVAGGRWIVALDDASRAGLHRHDPAALDTLRRIGGLLQFAEANTFSGPYGNLALLLDGDGAGQEDYLKLVARRQVPYRILPRAGLSAASLADFRAVLALALTPPSTAERKILNAFAERGGVVIAGPSWGDPPLGDSYAERPFGKGRIVVYREPDAESVARDLKDILSQGEIGVVPLNVPSVITYATGHGKGLLIHLLNYSNSPAESITLRAHGSFPSAKLLLPGALPADLPIKFEAGRVDVSIPRLSLWGAVLLR